LKKINSQQSPLNFSRPKNYNPSYPAIS